MELIDTHCHLTSSRFADDRDAVFARAHAAGLAGCISIGTGVADAREALALAPLHPRLAVCAGIDPFSAHELGPAFNDELQALTQLVRDAPVVAIGECGLDYHYQLDPPRMQQAHTVAQLELAREHELPVVLHVREAHADMIALLREHPGSRGVIHSFTAGPAEAADYLALGWHLAFNGIMTYKNAPTVRAAAAMVAADRLLLETDAPFLAPVPQRSRRCEPAHLVHTAEQCARVRGETVEQIARCTTANARRLFALPTA
ncbi:MAG: TatD family hydrolase [Planctomycetota bacterium]